MSLRTWIRARRHAAGLRLALGLAERSYAVFRARAADGDRPAIAGGRPARLFPLPSPRPYGPVERRAIRRALREQNTSYSDGDAIARLERELRERFGCRHAIAVSSGTAALHAAMIAAGIGPGDEVIVPALTHAATAMAVLQCGAAVRFADVDPDTWTLDASRVEPLVTARTRAIVPVHLCGVPCDMNALRAIAERRRLRIVEDAAQAHGATYEGRSVGTCGDLGCLSFQSTKSITTGEGGAVLTQDDALAARARLAMNLGESSGGRPTADRTDFPADAPLAYEFLGWNYRMGALQASLGIGQIAQIDSIRAVRNANAARLRRALSDCPGLRMQAAPAGASPCFSTFFVSLEGDLARHRDEIVRGLVRERIDCRLPYARPLSAHAIFGQPGRHEVAERICRSALGFRVDPSLGPAEIESVAFALRRLVAWTGR